MVTSLTENAFQNVPYMEARGPREPFLPQRFYSPCMALSHASRPTQVPERPKAGGEAVLDSLTWTSAHFELLSFPLTPSVDPEEKCTSGRKCSRKFSDQLRPARALRRRLFKHMSQGFAEPPAPNLVLLTSPAVQRAPRVVPTGRTQGPPPSERLPGLRNRETPTRGKWQNKPGHGSPAGMGPPATEQLLPHFQSSPYSHVSELGQQLRTKGPGTDHSRPAPGRWAAAISEAQVLRIGTAQVQAAPAGLTWPPLQATTLGTPHPPALFYLQS